MDFFLFPPFYKQLKNLKSVLKLLDFHIVLKGIDALIQSLWISIGDRESQLRRDSPLERGTRYPNSRCPLSLFCCSCPLHLGPVGSAVWGTSAHICGPQQAEMESAQDRLSPWLLLACHLLRKQDSALPDWRPPPCSSSSVLPLQPHPHCITRLIPTPPPASRCAWETIGVPSICMRRVGE